MVPCNVSQYVTDAEYPSVGSAAHGTGQCKPCAWYHKAKGCFRGKDCRHCHTCSPDELGKRKKDKVAVLRAQAKGEKLAAQSQALYFQAQRLMSRAQILSAHSRQHL